MDLSKMSIKKIRELIVFTALLVVALWKFDVVLGVLKTIWDIIFPFVLGGAIAFLTNVPMSFLEKKIFGRVKKENKPTSRQHEIKVAGTILVSLLGAMLLYFIYFEVKGKDDVLSSKYNLSLIHI